MLGDFSLSFWWIRVSGSGGSVMRSEGEVWEGMEVGVEERAYIVDWGGVNTIVAGGHTLL